MRLVILCSFICIGPLGTASGGDVTKLVLEEATQIVIGPTFGTSFNPTTEAVARIRDKKVIRQVLEVAVGKEPEEVDHYVMLPHLQVAVLNAKGEIIAAYALDRTPAHNSMRSRAVLRTAKVIQKDGKTTIDFKDIFKGFPCKVLEAYRFEDQELPEFNGEAGADQPATKSGDKVPAEVKPPTPSLKDDPR